MNSSGRNLQTSRHSICVANNRFTGIPRRKSTSRPVGLASASKSLPAVLLGGCAGLCLVLSGVCYGQGTTAGTALDVQTLSPKAGGVVKTLSQPATLEAFQGAALYAKVSGFLDTQNVDIGSEVKKGDLLARISVPELDADVQRLEAMLEQRKQIVAQQKAKAEVVAAQAKAAEASVKVAETVLHAKEAYRSYRAKQLARLNELMAERAIEPKVVDESEDEYSAAVEAEAAAREGISSAEQNFVAAKSRIAESKADILEAQAAQAVTAAQLKQAQVLLDYANIKSPYTGIVTLRSFNPGDFIRAAETSSASTPILSVERTDLMRVVLQVPNEYVQHIHTGDKAKLYFESLLDAGNASTQEATVARTSGAEDRSTRTMRVEFDLKNDKGLLRSGMYCKVTMQLGTSGPNAVSLPATALTNRIDEHSGELWVVKYGAAKKMRVTISNDNGINIEVSGGLTPQDQVIVKANGTLVDGVPVKVTNAKK